MSKWKCQLREKKVWNNPKRKCDDNNTRTDQCPGSEPGRGVIGWSGSALQYRFHIPISHCTKSVLCLERVLEASVLAFLFGCPFRRLKERRKQKISVLGMPVVYEVRLAQTRIMRKTAECKMGWDTGSLCSGIAPVSPCPPSPAGPQKNPSWPCSDTELLEATSSPGYFLPLNIWKSKLEVFF